MQYLIKTKEKAHEKDGTIKERWCQRYRNHTGYLRGNIKFKEVINEDTDNERIADLRTKQMMKQTQIRDLDPSKDDDKIDNEKK